MVLFRNNDPGPLELLKTSKPPLVVVSLGRDLPDADVCWKLDGELALSAKSGR
jgi:hypothetical protein